MAGEVLGSEFELMAMEGSLVAWVPMHDPPGDSSRNDTLVGGSDSCSPSSEEIKGDGGGRDGVPG